MRASRAVVATVEPHRLALPVLRMVAECCDGVLSRWLDGAFVDAALALPAINGAAAARAASAVSSIFDAVKAQPLGGRLPVLLALAYELLRTAPLAADLAAPCAWRNIVRGLGAAQTAAGCEITEAHEIAAAAIVAEVTL